MLGKSKKRLTKKSLKKKKPGQNFKITQKHDFCN